MKKGDHLFLVDGSGFIFRAFHALPPLTRKSDGLPVGAVSGFCNMLWKLLTDARDTSVGVTPSHFAVIFDYASKTFRKEIYDAYKANRSAPPEELVPQFGLIRQATRAFNLPCIETEGFEADDIIATYARKAEATGADVTIISSDKDLMQLVTDNVHMYDSMKDKQIGIPEVFEKWGVGPEKMIDLQALVGDSVDNVPGIPGIGPKTAAQLLEEFGDLDSLLARAGEIKQVKRRENILAHAEQARLSRRLVELRTDVPLDLDLEALVLEPQDGPKLVAFLKAMEFGSLTRRVASACDCDADAIDPAVITVETGKAAHGPDLDPGQAEDGAAATATAAPAAARPAGVKKTADETGKDMRPADLAKARADAFATAKIDSSCYVTIREIEELDDWIRGAVETGILAVEAEGNSIDPMQGDLVGLSLALADNTHAPSGGEIRSAYIPLGHRSGEGDLLGGGRAENQLSVSEALERLKPLLEDPAVLKLGHNLKFAYLLLKRYGVTLKSYDDVMLMSYVLEAGKGGQGLDSLSERWLGHVPMTWKDVAGSGKSGLSFDLVDVDKAMAYAAEKVDLALRLWFVLKPRLSADKLTKVYERLERPMVATLAEMEERGITIDRQILSRLSGELAQKAAAVEDEIFQLAGEKFTIGSPKQLGDILFGKMGLPGGAKTKTGQWSTSAQVLEELAAVHELPRKIVDWRQLTKLKSTYTDALPGYVHPQTKRVHTSYSLASTTTGRLSSVEPNLQNIPIRTAEGRKIRAAFISTPGHKLVSADYSQIELRVLAHVADIPQLRQAFADGIDIHSMTASEMFGVPVEGMPADIRRRAKAINFGIIYGISAFGLANQLSIERSEAGDYIKRYFERFPGIRDYMENTKSFAREHGYVETIFGRRAHYPEIRSSNPSVRAFNERAAINAPIQGSAADIIRRAMARMDTALADAGLKDKARMLLQVHDELIFEVEEGEIEPTLPVVVTTMEQAAMPAIAMRVPLKVDARAAANWDEAH